ncbi:MAG: lysine 5,6-aminomutase subunit alpha, partial [Bacilli bacterium]
MGKLRLDQKIIDSSRNLAKNISDDIKKMIDCHTTITVERAICR